MEREGELKEKIAQHKSVLTLPYRSVPSKKRHHHLLLEFLKLSLTPTRKYL